MRLIVKQRTETMDGFSYAIIIYQSRSHVIAVNEELIDGATINPHTKKGNDQFPSSSS